MFNPCTAQVDANCCCLDTPNAIVQQRVPGGNDQSEYGGNAEAGTDRPFLGTIPDDERENEEDRREDA